MTRYIGIRHRIKKTAQGEAHPTQVAICANDSVKFVKLKDEQAELDFLTSVKKDDVLAMTLGGSGDYLAYAASRVAAEVGASMMRTPPFVLASARKRVGGERKDDAALLAQLVQEHQHSFYPTIDRDRNLILVREHYRARTEAMKARIACEQRLHQRFIGAVFTASDGISPEGAIEKRFDAMKANDKILMALLEEEKERMKELERALKVLDVYQHVFVPIAGVGPAIAARLISTIVDIRRFEKASQLVAFCGAHVLPNGRFARRRSGELANWHNDARQALFLAGDQFNRRPKSQWGEYLRAAKSRLRDKHPEPIVVDGVKKYSDGHIHKMAIWRTLTRFVERQIFKPWWELEKAQTINGARKRAA